MPHLEDVPLPPPLCDPVFLSLALGEILTWLLQCIAFLVLLHSSHVHVIKVFSWVSVCSSDGHLIHHVLERSRVVLQASILGNVFRETAGETHQDCEKHVKTHGSFLFISIFSASPQHPMPHCRASPSLVWQVSNTQALLDGKIIRRRLSHSHERACNTEVRQPAI